MRASRATRREADPEATVRRSEKVRHGNPYAGGSEKGNYDWNQQERPSGFKKVVNLSGNVEYSPYSAHAYEPAPEASPIRANYGQAAGWGGGGYQGGGGHGGEGGGWYGNEF